MEYSLVPQEGSSVVHLVRMVHWGGRGLGERVNAPEEQIDLEFLQ